jgi:hypothetical protein
MTNWGLTPFAVNAYDNSETRRLRKYVIGAHLVFGWALRYPSFADGFPQTLKALGAR